MTAALTLADPGVSRIKATIWSICVGSLGSKPIRASSTVSVIEPSPAALNAPGRWS